MGEGVSEIQAPFIGEHESVDSQTGKSAGYNPSPEEKKVIQLVERLYSEAKKYRKRYDQRWTDWYKMFRGRQWKEVRPSYRSSEVLNLIFETIQSMIPILVDSKPKLEFLPTVPTQFEIADILTKVAANDWEHNNWLVTLIECLYDSHLYGTGFGYVGYNPDAEMGLGAIEFETQDNFYVFPDPNARDINGKRTKYFCIAEPVDIVTLKKEYPDNAAYITADVVDFQGGDKADIYQVMFKSPLDSKLIVEGPSGYDSNSKNQALKITIYSKDDDFEEEKEAVLRNDGTQDFDEEGNPKEKFVQKLKYPNGRKIVIAGGVLCEDCDMDFDDGLFPFIKMTNYLLPREFWGVGEVENLDSPQKTINKLLAFVSDAMALMGNPIFIVDDTSGVDTDNLFNKPGLIVEKTAGSEVRREPGVEIPSFILPLLDRYKQYFDGVSGQTDLSRGVESGSVTAASAIENLQQAQQTRLRLKSKHIDAFLQDFGKLYLSRVFQFYSVPRIIRISGDSNADKFFMFHVEKLDAIGPDGTPSTKHIAHVSDHNGMNPMQYEITSDFDVRVGTGSSLPFAKAEKSDISFKLFQLGVIDDEEVMKNLDYPNYEAVLQRVQQKKAQMQEQQMQLATAQQKAQLQDMQSKSQKMVAETKKTEAEAVSTQVDTAISLHHAKQPQMPQSHMEKGT